MIKSDTIQMGKLPLEIILLLLVTVLITILITRSQTTLTPEILSQLIPQAPVIINKGGDDRYSMAPRPQRVWNNGPETPGIFDSRHYISTTNSSELPVLKTPVRGALDPIPTRGEPEAYQQMGVLVGSDGKPLPLYGRRTGPRSDRFNYYTRTDSYNPVALPVTYKRRDCQDNLGCDELYNGDEIRMAGTGDTAKVTLYGFDGPRYVG